MGPPSGGEVPPRRWWPRSSRSPRPRSFFGWIVGLATIIGAVLPFATDGSAGGKLATAATDLVLGLCILSLLSSVLARTTRVAGPPSPQGGLPDRGPYR